MMTVCFVDENSQFLTVPPTVHSDCFRQGGYPDTWLNGLNNPRCNGFVRPREHTPRPPLPSAPALVRPYPLSLLVQCPHCQASHTCYMRFLVRPSWIINVLLIFKWSVFIVPDNMFSQALCIAKPKHCHGWSTQLPNISMPIIWKSHCQVAVYELHVC